MFLEGEVKLVFVDLIYVIIRLLKSRMSYSKIKIFGNLNYLSLVINIRIQITRKTILDNSNRQMFNHKSNQLIC